jgi:uncharacterized protein YndB with AHSA1/START domain
MSRSFERTFEVRVPIDVVWTAMTDPDELNKWYFPFHVDDEGTAHTEILGSDRPSEILEFDPPRKLRMANRNGPDSPWPPLPESTTEMTVALEATDSGTRVTITHSGFGDGDDWDRALDSVTRGSEESIADLILYLETGVPFPRHPAERSFHGIAAHTVPAGLKVQAVHPASFAQRLGLQPGDLVVEIGGAPVFGYHELWFFTREHNPGEIAAAAWIRDGELMRGSAELGSRAEALVSS